MTPQPTLSPVPTRTSPPARSPVPTQTPVPTRTPVPSRTAPPTREAVPTSSPIPPPPTPAGQVGPLVYPPGANPLTGLLAADPLSLNRRPLAIKVSNFPPCVRPQSGLSGADLVFEHYAEGGATRFTAIFYGNDPGAVGSVRSARLVDLELPAMYRALFAFSGASAGVLARLEGADFRLYQLSPEYRVGCPPFCRRPVEQTPCGQAGEPLLEHTEYTSTRALWAYAAAQGLNDRPDLTGMVFNARPPAGGQPGERLTMPYVGSFVQWLYGREQGVYYRRQDGSSHVDASTGLPLTAANVVVVFAPHVVSDIIEDTVGYDPRTGKGGHYSLEIQLWGSGPAFLFRDGQAYEGYWTRFEREAALALVVAGDRYLPFKPGNTWFQLAPADSAPSREGGVWVVRPPKPPDTPFGP